MNLFQTISSTGALPSANSSSAPYTPAGERARTRTFSAGVSSPTKPPSSLAEGGVPLTIVGTKVDKISASTRKDLQAACPQHIFVSSRTNDFNPILFYDFFNHVYDRHRQAKGVPDGYDSTLTDIISKLQNSSGDVENHARGTSSKLNKNGDASSTSVSGGVTPGSSLRHRNTWL